MLILALGLLYSSPVRVAWAEDGLTVIRDEEIERTLKKFSAPVFEQAGLRTNDVQLVIIGSPVINAFVAGGMNMFFFTGLILETKTPEEMIGVIAHETGHIAGGHLVRTREAIEHASVQAIVATVLGIAAAIGTGQAEAAAAISSGGQSLAMSGMLEHSRVQEASADQAAVRFLEDAGISGSGMVSFLEKLQSQELVPASRQAEYVRTHPLTRDRIQLVENSVKNARAFGKKLPDDFYEDYARMRAKLVAFMFPQRVSYEFEDSDHSIAADYARAIADYRQDHIDEGLKATEALILREPENPYFHELKGQILLENGRLAEATTAYRQAVALLPDSGLLRVALAHALIEGGFNNAKDLREAIDLLQKAKQAEPRSTQLHRLLATAYGRVGEEGLARLNLAEEALLQRNIALAKKQAEAAVVMLKEGSAGWLRAQDILKAAEKS